MSIAKEKTEYILNNVLMQDEADWIQIYIDELEQELTKLKESQTQLCNRVDKAEAEKAELKKAISFYYTYHKDSRNDGVIFEEFNKICPMK